MSIVSWFKEKSRIAKERRAERQRQAQEATRVAKAALDKAQRELDDLKAEKAKLDEYLRNPFSS